VTASLRTVSATRYVIPLREGGSLPGLVEADDDGLYVLKFRGAGQGVRALIAEVLAGELARVIGLPVPELVLVEIDPALGRAEPDVEIKELIDRSPGINLGVDFLPGALPFDAGGRPPPEPDLAAAIVWFDGLLNNPDRTARNPNLLVWHRRLWCIDHGAALYVHHTWRDPDAHAARTFDRIADHVLLPYAGPIDRVAEPLAAGLDTPTLRRLVESLPADWLREAPAAGATSVDATRTAYLRYLAGRVAASGATVDVAERARLEVRRAQVA
jgi:hypothetical protein